MSWVQTLTFLFGFEEVELVEPTLASSLPTLTLPASTSSSSSSSSTSSSSSIGSNSDPKELSKSVGKVYLIGPWVVGFPVDRVHGVAIALPLLCADEPLSCQTGFCSV